jgi:hypothetical protein
MIVPEGEADQLVVYLLHFDSKLNGKQHYIGSTMYRRRFTRWREHALGNGSAYVSRFIRNGIGFRVVRLWYCRTRQHEQALKGKGLAAEICPICSPHLPQPEPYHYEANAWTPTISAHWSNRKSGAR